MTELLPSDRAIWIVAGAGISLAAPASIPVWGKMKEDTLKHAISVLAHEVNTWGGFSRDLVDALDNAQDTLLEFPEEAMEDLCMAYGEESTANMLASALRGSTLSKPLPTAAHLAITQLVHKRRVVGIITTNFDTLFEEALSSVEFQTLLSGEIPFGPVSLPLLKVHGSINVPSSMSFRRSAYYAGFPDRLVSYVREAVRDSHVVIVGYSGDDSDLFPLIRDVLMDGTARNTATVVNPTRPAKDSRLDSLLKLNNVKYASCTKLSRLSWEFDQRPGNVRSRLCDGLLGVNEVS